MNLRHSGRALAGALLCIALAACSPATAPGAVGAPGLGPSSGTAPKVGDPAPAFSLQTVDGQTVSSASLANERKPYVLFFFATW